jgi:putative FmdB family regulatory protein|tara:strand:- start:16542 stop:16907 length:366 start_codon:yes stop_codon:yes gene_type:complete
VVQWKEKYMPTYDFECEKCAYYTEITQRMDEPSEYECPHCGEETLIKVFINPPAMFVRGSPNTIGQLADRNTSKMGTYELQDKTHEHGMKQDQKAKQARETNRKINAMTPEQKINWIKNGD